MFRFLLRCSAAKSGGVLVKRKCVCANCPSQVRRGQGAYGSLSEGYLGIWILGLSCLEASSISFADFWTTLSLLMSFYLLSPIQLRMSHHHSKQKYTGVHTPDKSHVFRGRWFCCRSSPHIRYLFPSMTIYSICPAPASWHFVYRTFAWP